jgi:hypothetical protein
MRCVSSTWIEPVEDEFDGEAAPPSEAQLQFMERKDAAYAEQVTTYYMPFFCSITLHLANKWRTNEWIGWNVRND